MTKNFEDGVTPRNEANYNKFAMSDGTVAQADWGGRIRYTGAAWEMVANQGQSVAQAALIVLTWVGGSNRLEVDHSACTNPFTGVVSPVVSPAATANNNYAVKAVGLSADVWFVKFYDNVTDALITAIDTRMDFCFHVTGPI